MPNHPLASVVVLSYDRPRELAAGLKSIERQSYDQLEVLVVDNPSTRTNDIVGVVRQHAGMQLLRNPVNRGFTGGMNAGIFKATGKYIFLTEDDIILERDCIRILVDYMEQHPGVGLVSGIMFNKSEKTIRCAGGRVSLGKTFQKEVIGVGEHDATQFREPFEVNYIPGAFMMGRRDLLQQMGGFREDFFMYFDDTELCLRMCKLGHRIVVVPGATVQHWEPQTSNVDPRIIVHKYKNLLAVYTLHARFSILPEFFVRYVGITLAKTLVTDWRMAVTFLRGFICYLWLLPSLLRARSVRRLVPMRDLTPRAEHGAA